MTPITRRPGNKPSRNATEFGSMMRKSKNDSVIHKMSNLNCEARMSRINVASDSAAAIAGRRRTTSHTKFRKPHASNARAL